MRGRVQPFAAAVAAAFALGVPGASAADLLQEDVEHIRDVGTVGVLAETVRGSIEAVTGRDWSAEVTDRILRPLGMTETSEPGTDPTLPAPFPRGYELFSDDGPYVDTTEHNMTWGGAAGSLISTPRDVSRFFRALLGGELLPPAQMAAMKTTVPMGPEYEEVWPGARYGLGIIRSDLPCGGRYWHHGGDVVGYSNTNGVAPGGRRSAMVASSTNTFGDPEFAAGSLRYANELVWNALCGYDTDPD